MEDVSVCTSQVVTFSQPSPELFHVRPPPVGCWCRLMAPAEEYVSTFAPTLQRAQLAWRCAAVMHDNPFISYEAALPNVRS